jgi:hypothetical protein
MTADINLSRSILGIVLGTVLLLLIPITAMQLTSEVDWTLFDFVVAGFLLLSTGFTNLWITRTSSSNLFRFASILAVGSGLFLIWSNLAVGIIGSEDELINMGYFFIPLLGLLGAWVSKTSAVGMARTLAIMAGTQLLIMVIALLWGWQHVPGSSVMEIMGVNMLFIVAFGLSALFYRKAAMDLQS